MQEWGTDQCQHPGDPGDPLQIAAPGAQGALTGLDLGRGQEVGFWLFGKETRGPRNPGNGLEVGVLALCAMVFSSCEEEHNQLGSTTKSL